MCLGVKSISSAKSLQLDELWQTTMNLLFLMVAIVWSFILERSFVWLISNVCRLLVQVFIYLTQYFHDDATFVITCFAEPNSPNQEHFVHLSNNEKTIIS